MSTELAPIGASTSLSVHTQIGPKEVELIKRTICKGASDDELKMFIAQCNRTGLDPFARQIYSIERKENVNGQWQTTRSVQVSIDGFRLIAERTGKYCGQVGPQWCGADGRWKDVWLDEEFPLAARIGILRTDFKEPLWGTATLRSYGQRKKDGGFTKMWAGMPDVMLAKVAETVALRRAFPQELSGLYSSDEMMQASSYQASSRQSPHPQNLTAPAPANSQAYVDVEYDEDGVIYEPPARMQELINEDQVLEIAAKVREAGADLKRFAAYFQVAEIADLPASRYNDALAAIEAKRNANAKQQRSVADDMRKGREEYEPGAYDE